MIRIGCLLLLAFPVGLVGCGDGSVPAPPLAAAFVEPLPGERVPLGANVGFSVVVESPGGDAWVEIAASRSGAEISIAAFASAGDTHAVVWPTGEAAHGAYELVLRVTEGDESVEVVADTSIVLDAPASVVVLAPQVDEAPEGLAEIRYLDDDPDSAAQTTLYAETETDRLRIRIAQAHGGGVSRTVEWDLSLVPPGAYTIVAVIDDGVNEPAVAASTGRVHVLGALAATTPGAMGVTFSDFVIYPDSDAMGIDTFEDGSFVVAGSFSGEGVWGEGQPNETRVVAAGEQDIFVARYDAARQLQWVRTAGGDGPDSVGAVAAFPDGSCVVVGGARDGAHFGPGENALGDHAYFARYDAVGELSWLHSHSTSLGRASCVEPLPDGGFLAGGWFFHRITFDWDHAETRARLEPETDSSYVDAFLVRCSADGRVVWARLVDAVNGAHLRAITLLPDGSAVATGSFESGVTVNAGEADAAAFTSPWSSPQLVSRCFVGRWDSDGGLVWARAIDGTSECAGWDVAPHPDGGAVVIGSFRNVYPPGNDVLIGSVLLEASVGQQVGFAARYELDGDVSWARPVGPGQGTSDPLGRPTSIAALGDRGFAIAGFFNGRRDLGGETVATTGGRDLFLARYDLGGFLQSHQTAGGTGNDDIWTMAIAPQGWLLLTGSFEGVLALAGQTLQAATPGPNLLVARLTVE